jgi:tryptophan synthase alpha chain
VGFGIKTPERAAAVARVADAVVVGSVLVDLVAEAIAADGSTENVTKTVLATAASLAQAVHEARIDQGSVPA